MSGTTLPGPQVDIEVCLAIGTIEPGGVWDSGHWNYNTWNQTDTPLGDWSDVTCDVIVPLTLGSGTSPDGVVTRWEAQTCAFSLYGDLYDPRSGPYVGLLGPALPVRVRWKPTGTDDTVWRTTFLGQTTDDGFTYDPKTRRAAVSATDATAIFAAYDGVEQGSQGSGETAAARVTRIADMVGWPAARRDITAGGVALQATTLADAAWTLLLAVADTDLAVLWIDRAGNLAFRPEGKVKPSHTLAAIISCDPPPPDITAPTIAPVNIVGQQPTVTRNVVSISRQARDETDTPATATVRDEASVSRFLTHSYSRTDLLHVDDLWSTTVAQAVIMSSAWPSTSPAAVELSSRADPASSALLLTADPSLSVEVHDRGNVWECEPAGWQVTISPNEISGSLALLDVTVWFGTSWDGGGWDLARWGF